MKPEPEVRMRSLISGNVLWLGIISLLNDAASDMIFPLLPVFLVQALGAGPAFLGLVEGVAESTSSLVKLAGGWLSDRTGRRKALVGWGYGVAGVVRPLIALATAPWHVLVVRFTDRVGKGLRTAPRDALLAESVEPERRGTAFGIHRAADHAGAVLGPLLAAGILLLAPGQLRLVFALAAVPAALSVVLLVWKVREGAPATTAAPQRHEGGGGGEGDGLDDALSHTAGGGLPRAPVAGGPAPALPPSFRAYLAAMAVFTLGNASDAFLLLRAEQVGVPVATLPLLWGAFHVSKMLWSVPGGMLADRFGARRAIVVGWLVYAAMYAAFGVATSAWHGWALFLVYGLFYGLTEAPQKALVARLAPAERRAGAYGAFHFVVGLTALPGSLVFGGIWQAFGAAAAFGAGAALALAAALVLALGVPADAQRPEPAPAAPGVPA